MLQLQTFWSLKASVPIHCCCMEMRMKNSLQNISFRRRKKSYRFGTTLGWQHCGWIIPSSDKFGVVSGDFYQRTLHFLFDSRQAALEHLLCAWIIKSTTKAKQVIYGPHNDLISHWREQPKPRSDIQTQTTKQLRSWPG